MSEKIAVIGSGFAGLSAATYLAKAGHDVTILEKNDSIGGRARIWESGGFRFDMGPSWYWMPDIFERYFNDFGYDVKSLYKLERLDPSYRVFFGIQDHLDIPAGIDAVKTLFESMEPGSALKLDKFMNESRFKYEMGMHEMVYKPGLSAFEFFDRRILSGMFRMHLFKSHAKYTRRYFSNPRIQKLLEFPVLFLGATPEKTPALYSMMNYSDMVLGTWYPQGGMFKIVEAMTSVAQKFGVKIRTNSPVSQIHTQDRLATHVSGIFGDLFADNVVAAADYHFVETSLLNKEDRSYSDKYWNSRTLAPSCLIFYLGIRTKVKGLRHHNLFFDREFGQHAEQIYKNPTWPDDPLFYVCCPSKTDSSVAPEGHENLFILMPVAPGIPDSETIRERYFDLLIQRLEEHTGMSIRENIVVKRSYAIDDFKSDYNSFKGNAYGLANTLRQTAILKPRIKSKKISNLYYAGQLTVPGPGVPPSLISGKIVADLIAKNHR